MGAEQRTASSYTSASPMEVSGGRRRVDTDGRTRTDRCHACTTVGKHTLLFGRKRSRFPAQLMVGPDWQCMLCTYALIITPTVFFLLGVASNMPLPVLVVGVATFAGALIAFSAAACSDPGIVFREPGLEGRDEEGPPPGMRYCALCDLHRPKEAYHCYDCEVCVLELDHHCPWTGKCIGNRNLRAFYAFLTALSVHTLYVALVTLVYFATD